MIELEKTNGGYTGEDIVEIARIIGRSYSSIWRLIREKPPNSISSFTYLGRREGSLKPEEIEEIKNKISENYLYSGQFLLWDLNEKRDQDKLDLIPKKTFYRTLSKLYTEMGIDENDPYRWLTQIGISVKDRYTIEEARKSLKKIFTLDDLSSKLNCLKSAIPSFASLTSQQAAGHYADFQDGNSFSRYSPLSVQSTGVLDPYRNKNEDIICGS